VICVSLIRAGSIDDEHGLLVPRTHVLDEPVSLRNRTLPTVTDRRDGATATLAGRVVLPNFVRTV
jgi:hypothetical protein